MELLLDELSCAERSILVREPSHRVLLFVLVTDALQVHESMLLNAVSEDGVPIGGGRSTHRSNFSFFKVMNQISDLFKLQLQF